MMQQRVLPPRGHRRVPIPAQVIVYAILSIGAFFMLFPLLNMLGMSLKTMGEMASSPISFPHSWQWSNYATAWQEGSLGRYLINSTLVSAASVFFVALFSSMAAYVLARFAFRGNTLIYLLFLAGLALPIPLIAVPLFIIMKNFNLINNLLSVILVYVASGMSFSVFLLVTFFRTIPVELEEAARIEGANSFQIYAYIMVPLVRPALTTVALFNFVGSWNGLFFPLIFLSDKSQMTVTVGVLSFVGQYGTQWNLLLPALVIVILPTVMVFSLASRQFIRGLTAGAVRA